MIVRSVRVKSFRNYVGESVALPPGLVAFTGDNGQGKTNLLEALCVLATTKSPLVERDRELIHWDQRSARIEAEIELSAGPIRRTSDDGKSIGEIRRLAYEWKLEGASIVRDLQVGGVPQSLLGQWLGQLQVVAFFPHDLTLITGDPAERRRFLNIELGKTRPAHFSDAARYRRALQQRNALLKYLAERRGGPRNPAGPEGEGLGTLSEWNRQLVGYGARILEQREQFLSELSPLLAEVHRRLSGREELFVVDYVPGLRAPRENSADSFTVLPWSTRLSAALETDHEVDLRRGSTQSGPHRDDLVFRLGEMDLRRFGSQGQQRMAVLSLKIALAHWVKEATGEPPVLLLDDALSELDADRRRALLEEASIFPQSILTATDTKFLQDVTATIFHIDAGRISSAIPTDDSSPSAENILNAPSVSDEIPTETVESTES